MDRSCSETWCITVYRVVQKITVSKGIHMIVKEELDKQIQLYLTYDLAVLEYIFMQYFARVIS